MELRDPWNSRIEYLLMASFKGGDNSTDPRRCTAHSRQTGKRSKNASAWDKGRMSDAAKLQLGMF
jgi:hypothetical protein